MGDESFVITSGTDFVSTIDPGLNYTDSSRSPHATKFGTYHVHPNFWGEVDF